MARKDWFYRFVQRHPGLSLRTPENTSLTREKDFNKVLLENSMIFWSPFIKNITYPEDAYNMGETGIILTVANKSSNILAVRGKNK